MRRPWLLRVSKPSRRILGRLRIGVAWRSSIGVPSVRGQGRAMGLAVVVRWLHLAELHERLERIDVLALAPVDEALASAAVAELRVEMDVIGAVVVARRFRENLSS